MDNKIALERMKQLLCDISTKNETLNKENNDLNIKVLSLIKLLKAKDNQIDGYKKLLLKEILKNIFYKKHLIEREKLKRAIEKFKNLIVNNNGRGKIRHPLLFYTHENDLYFSPSKKYNCKDIGVGDFKINYRFYIRKVACLTLLKRRRYITNIDDNKNRNNIKGQDIGYKINFVFKNILPEYSELIPLKLVDTIERLYHTILSKTIYGSLNTLSSFLVSKPKRCITSNASSIEYFLPIKVFKCSRLSSLSYGL